jgi:hypothetical protein
LVIERRVQTGTNLLSSKQRRAVRVPEQLAFIQVSWGAGLHIIEVELRFSSERRRDGREKTEEQKSEQHKER